MGKAAKHKTITARQKAIVRVRKPKEVTAPIAGQGIQSGIKSGDYPPFITKRLQQQNDAKILTYPIVLKGISGVFADVKAELRELLQGIKMPDKKAWELLVESAFDRHVRENITFEAGLFADGPIVVSGKVIKRQSLKCQIIDIKQDVVLADVLINEQASVSKIQIFDRRHLSDAFSLKEGDVFIMDELLIMYAHGRKEKGIYYKKGTKADKAIFDKLDAITDPENDRFFKPAPDTTTEDNF
jgi:hypothetical protein